MSYKSRERKRRARLAQTSGRQKQRAEYADRHYLTIVTRPACCNRCGGSLRRDAECVFRYRPKLILCVNCADREGIRYRPSLRWERQKSDGRSPQTRKRWTT
jgi:hypothetical protein